MPKAHNKPVPMVTNVLLTYKRIADDIRNHTRIAPTFQDGLKLMELIHDIERRSKKPFKQS